MRTASCRLAHDGRALQGLQIVRERLGGRKRVRGREHIDRLGAAEAPPGDAILRPGLARAVGITVPQIIEVSAAVEEVRRNQGADVMAAAVLPEVDDERASAGEERHGGRGGGSAESRLLERVEPEVADIADIAVQLLDFLESTVGLVQVRVRRRGRRFSGWL